MTRLALVEHEGNPPEPRIQYNTVLTEVAATASSMSPDTNHNELSASPDSFPDRMNGIHKEAAVPEEVLNGVHPATKTAAVRGRDDQEGLEEYLRRGDTAVIYPEPVGGRSGAGDGVNHSALGETALHAVVPTLANGLIKEAEEPCPPSEFIKCPQCQKGYQTFQALKEHIEASHSSETMCHMENGAPPALGASSPSPNLVGPGGPFGCSQCTTSFATKDQLEKHELLHSPNAQVSCKICNKTFANVYRLQRHMISHDESAVLRKFKCTECDKAFKFKHHLKEHIRIHSGEKPFECGNCGKRFSHSGSYSSHMTSKKCLVMNLKLGRTRAPTSNQVLDKNSQNARTLKRPHPNPLNNNITTSPNHNAYLPILPKYTEAAAAFLQSSLAGNPAMTPFYITPPSLLNSSGHAISPYTIPSLTHLLEQLQSASPVRPPLLEAQEANPEELKSVHKSPKTEHCDDTIKSNGSSCGDLVMDEDAEQPAMETQTGCENPTNGENGDLEAVKRILETVNATVTKQLLQANMQKFSSETSSDCHSVTSLHSPRPDPSCSNCKKTFASQSQYETHECDPNELKSEGLAAKLEEVATSRAEDTHDNISDPDEDQDFEHEKGDDYGMDCESVTTTDHVSEDGRKVRVRSLISDEQLKILRDNYAINPRPKREELVKIASTIGFPVRVVQVWFQNTRARDRREGRMIQVPYSPAPSIPIRFPMVPSNPQSLKMLPDQYISEQPLDLSTKKGVASPESSPSNSPLRPPSENHHSDSGDEAVNLSHKSSRSPTPYQQLHYQSQYQNSSCSSEPMRTPSPADYSSNSRLAQILAQPAHKLPLPGMGLIPMDQLMQFGAADLPSLSQLINNRMSNLSPSSEKRWSEGGDTSHDGIQDEEMKRNKMQPFMLKSLGSPVLGNPDNEPEGQFTCDQCDKAFSKQSSLARHKYEHSGQRPHKCDECPKAFKHKHHLTEHKRLHSGEKPFQCCKCLKRFSHSGSYSQHMNHRYSYCKPYRE